MDTKASKLTYLTHVDAIRAFAVLLVILFHLEINIFSGGFLAVDVFFVISGFLITRLLVHEFYESGTISFKTFYTRRIRRLMPTLFLTIFLTFVLTFLSFSPSDFMNATNSMFMSAVALSNFFFLSESDYFDIYSNFKPLLHTWSLGIEEQFYLLFPAFLFVLLKVFGKNKKGIILSLILLAVLSICYTYFTSQSTSWDALTGLLKNGEEVKLETSSVHFYLLPFRLFEFLIGGIVALMRIPKIKSELSKLGIHAIGLLIVFGSTLLLSKDTAYLSLLNIIPCIGVAILLYFSPSKYLSFIYDNKFLRYTGKISYTLYLMHWLVIVIYRYVFNADFGFIEQFGMFAIMYLLSALIYEYYEKPLRYTKAKFSIKSNQSLMLILIIGVLTVYILRLKVNSEEGWLWRLSEENLTLIEEIGVPKEFHKNNWGGAGYKTIGWIGKEPENGVQADMVWIGDSHATHFKYGIDSIFVKKNNKHVYFPYLPSILTLPDIIFTKRGEAFCKKYINLDLKVINKHPNAAVVVSHKWMKQMSLSEVFNDETSQYDQIPNDSVGWQVLAQKIEKLHSLIGKNRLLIVLGETPKLLPKELNYIEKISRPKYLDSIVPPMVSTFPNDKVAFNAFFKKYFEGKSNIVFIDPSAPICKDGTCVIQEGKSIYFSDSNHLTKEGAVKVLGYFEQQILDLLNRNQ